MLRRKSRLIKNTYRICAFLIEALPKRFVVDEMRGKVSEGRDYTVNAVIQ